jgi:hypothetical protein
MSDASIIIVTTHGVAAMQGLLHSIRETVDRSHDVVVLASDCTEPVARFLVRQYLSGRIAAFEVASGEVGNCHCGLERAAHVARGDYLVRVDDSLRFQDGWLGKAIRAFESDPDIGCLSLVQPPDYHRGRGRPATVHVRPERCSSLDMRGYMTSRDLVARHQRELMGEEVGGGCAFQRYLERAGRRLAYLPGLAKVIGLAAPPRCSGTAHEADLPMHEGATGAMQRLEQAYDIGDDVLLTCMACGGTQLEVLAARIIFCTSHQVATGYWYELRCPECGELLFKDDLQFSCPS